MQRRAEEVPVAEYLALACALGEPVSGADPGAATNEEAARRPPPR
jgi:hypothetical protein